MEKIETPDETQNNIEHVRRFYKAAETGDWDLIATFIDDAVFELHEPDSLPYGGVYKGVAGQRRVFEQIMKIWQDPSWRIENIIGGGELVITYMQLYGVGVKTGMSFSMPVAEVFRVRNGRIVELRPIYWDTVRVRQCAGL